MRLQKSKNADSYFYSSVIEGKLNEKLEIFILKGILNNYFLEMPFRRKTFLNFDKSFHISLVIQ